MDEKYLEYLNALNMEYLKGLEDAVEAIEYLVFIEKWPLEKAIDYLKYSVKADKLDRLFDRLEIPKKIQ